MDIKAIVSIVIFALCYLLIAVDRSPRVYVVLSGVVLLILFKVYTPQEVPSYVDWETIGFLFGIFITIKIIEESGFFNYFSLLLAKKLDFNPAKIFIFFPLMACFLSGLMDSISVIAFLVPLTFALSKILKFDPIPFVIAEVSLANIGGSGTLMGDPPNIILGSMFGLGFLDFFKHNWILSMSGAGGAISVLYLVHRKELLKTGRGIDKEALKKLAPADAIEDKLLMKIGVTCLLTTITLLIVRDFVREVLPLNIALTSLVPTFTMLTVKGNNPKLKNVSRRIDIETLLFLVGLFAIIGALEKTGVLRSLAMSVSGFAEHTLTLVAVLFWGGALTSSVIDNVPAAISIGLLIKNLMPILTGSFTLLIWAASLGLDIGGNLTPIGASANVVAYSFMESHHARIGWGKWLRLAFLPTLVALSICWAGLVVKYRIGFY